LHAHAPKGAAVFKTARSTFPCTAAKWSRRPGSHRHGHKAQRVLNPPCLRSNHAAKKLVRTEGIAPSRAFARRLLGPTCLLFHHVRMKKNGASTGTCALLTVLPRQSVAFYGLDAWSKRKDLHLRSPSGHRVYSAPHLLLCHASKKMGARAGLARAHRARCFALRLRWPGRAAALPHPTFVEIGGSSRSCTCDRLLMRELRSLLRHRAKMVGRLGNAPSSAA
jgi:hypothetical protein